MRGLHSPSSSASGWTEEDFFCADDGGRIPAPAKLNLSLAVVGRRGDGMHLIDSRMILIDFCDWLYIRPRRDGKILRRGKSPIAAKDDLAIAAARLLQNAAGADKRGAEIVIAEKNIPVGGGLGGGSSDAASVLLALNRLWKINFSRAKLQTLAARLGADAPFFIFGEAARARGIGEKLGRCSPPPLEGGCYLIVAPQARADTARVYRKFDDLTKAAVKRTITNSPDGNDLTASACALYPRIGAALADLRQAAGYARLSGSGACVFAPFAERAQAQAAARKLRGVRRFFCAPPLCRHPLAAFAA
jgi:4-diphosphocytidyl-2-C-methyl-D-erythritol kinase